jgi:hypothetical protein
MFGNIFFISICLFFERHPVSIILGLFVNFDAFLRKNLHFLSAFAVTVQELKMMISASSGFSTRTKLSFFNFSEMS